MCLNCMYNIHRMFGNRSSERSTSPHCPSCGEIDHFCHFFFCPANRNFLRDRVLDWLCSLENRHTSNHAIPIPFAPYYVRGDSVYERPIQNQHAMFAAAVGAIDQESHRTYLRLGFRYTQSYPSIIALTHQVRRFHTQKYSTHSSLASTSR